MNYSNSQRAGVILYLTALLFGGYLIKAVPVLEAYDGTGYVSCNNATMLFDECYEWEAPGYLAQCFGNTKKVLVKRNYAGFPRRLVLLR